MTIEENLAGEMRLRQAVETALQHLGAKGSILDVGCGYGRLAPVFCAAGLAYLGIDVSDEAIRAARLFEPRGRYIVGSALAADWGGPFDLIAATYVLVHFVDDRDWQVLLGRIAASLCPGGCFLMADKFRAVETTPAIHVKERTLSQYDDEFAKLGMRFDAPFYDRLVVEQGGSSNLHLVRKDR